MRHLRRTTLAYLQEHMCLLWIPGAGVLVQTFQFLALPVKEGLVLPAPLGWGGGGGGTS